MHQAAVILGLIVLNGLFASAELALVSARRARLKALAEAGHAGARAALALLDDPTRLLSSVQIGITTVGILTGVYSGAAYSEGLAAWVTGIHPPIEKYAQEIAYAAIVVVMNTTLVSVTQRTHEIGIRRALGARRVSVLLETMAESSVIALVGGAAGVLIAAAVVAAASGRVGVPLALEWPTLAGSLAAAGVAGVAAGWYPARRAASLDVVAALRQE